MTIVTDFTPAEKALPYADEVAELAKAHEQHGDKAAFPLTVKGVKDAESGAIEYPITELTKFQNAARAAGYSARVARLDVDEKAGTATRFIQLGKRRTRKAKDATVDAEAS